MLFTNALSALLFGALLATAVRRAATKTAFAYPYIFLAVAFFIVFLVLCSNLLELTIGFLAVDSIEEYLEILILPFVLLFAYSWSATERFERNRTYLRQLHHRVKNNLQIVENILDLSADSAESSTAAEEISLIREKIAVLGLSERLAMERESTDLIDMGAFLRETAEGLLAAPARAGCSVVCDCGGIRLHPHQAVPCALLLAEALSRTRGCAAEVRMAEEEGRITYSIKDAGIPERNCSSGIPAALVSQLRANLVSGTPLLLVFSPQADTERL